ncbi:MAG: nSTAND1 domain-containing NTPase, partial [Nostoc sp.]
MPEFSRNMAFIIGINNYTNGISPLQNAVNDAKKLVEILRQKHEYEVWVCLDEVATLSNLNKHLEKILPEQVSENDRLLFYFAGHGIALNGDDGPEGYLIPQDAKLGDVLTYLPMTKLQESLSKLPCRHFLGILDCCFAGAFRWSSNRDLLTTPEVIHKERYDRFITDPAWQVITSAASDQKALDAFALNSERGQRGNHSPFAAALIQALAGEADIYPPATNGKPAGDGVITATELYLYLRHEVEPATEGNRQRQTPGIWPLKKHDKGEYIFLSPGHPLNLPPAPPLDASKNPYRGLESYDEKHSKLFFGRTELVEKLHNFVKTHPLTVVLGASGSGKSSLVKAGLIPKLRQDNTEQWCILPLIRPGETPLQALNNALKNAKLPEVAAQNQQQSLAMTIDAWGKNHPKIKLLLFIDQSEEIITLCQNEDERKEFFQQILKAINVHRDRLRVVLSLRSDFEPQVRDAGLKFVPTVINLENTVLESRWYSGRFIIPAMKRGELRQAIEKPAETQVMYFQPYELVEKLIDEVADMPGALPLLSFALSELYLKYLKRQRDGQNEGITIDRALTQKDYDDLGGVIQSLTKRADEEYETLVKENPAYTQIIRHVMLRMIALGGGELARRRVPLSELEYPPEKNSFVTAVIERFTKARLLVKGDDADGNPYVEPAHDALVRGWQKLLMWKQEEQESLLLQQRLTPAATEWDSIKNKDKEQPKGILDRADFIFDLLDRIPLTVENLVTKIPIQLPRLLRWAVNQLGLSRQTAVQFLWNANPYLEVLDKEFNSDDNWFNQVEAEFVQQSVFKKHRNIRMRWRGAFAVIVVLSALTIWAKINEAKTLRESAEINLQKNQSKDGMVDSLKAGNILNNMFVWLSLPINQLRSKTDLREQVRGTLLRAVYTVRELDRQEADQGMGTVRTSFSPDGKLLASAGENCNVPVRVWDFQSQTLSKSNFIKFKDKPDKSDNFYYNNKCEPVKITRFSPNSQQLAVAGAKGTVGVWDLRREDKELIKLKIWPTEQGEVKSINFSPDGKLLATAGSIGTVLIWNLDNLSEKPENLCVFDSCFKDKQQQVWSVAFSPDGKRLASAGDNGTIRLWDRKGNEWKENIKFDINEKKYDITSVSFSPDGQKLASAGRDGIISVWDLKNAELVKNKQVEKKIPTNQNTVWEVAFSPDGKKLASAGQDGTVRLWDLNKSELDKSELDKFEGHYGPVRSVSFNRDHQELASAGDDGTVRLWNLQGNESEKFEVNLKDAPKDPLVAVSPDGKLRASPRKEDEGTVVWDNLQSPAKSKIQSKGSHVGPVKDLAFSPDSKLLASAGKDRTVRLWNLDDGEQKFLLPTYAEVNSVAFSPDGKLLASAGKDGMVQLWNLQDDLGAGKPFAAWKAYPGSVKKVSFCRDGKVLITAGEDGTVKLWPIESFHDLMQQASVPVDNKLQNNPNFSESDRHLCDDLPVSVTSPISPIPSPTTSPPTVILPSAIAEDYYTRGSEQADSEYIKNFAN